MQDTQRRFRPLSRCFGQPNPKQSRPEGTDICPKVLYIHRSSRRSCPLHEYIRTKYTVFYLCRRVHILRIPTALHTFLTEHPKVPFHRVLCHIQSGQNAICPAP